MKYSRTHKGTKSQTLGLVGILGNDQWATSDVVVYSLSKSSPRNRQRTGKTNSKVRMRTRLKARPFTLCNALFKMLT